MAKKTESLDELVKRLDEAEKEYAEKASLIDLDKLLEETKKMTGIN